MVIGNNLLNVKVFILVQFIANWQGEYNVKHHLMIRLQLHKSSCTDTIIFARMTTKMTVLYICEHTHAIQPVHFPLYIPTPTAVLHAQIKEEKGCGAQDRESIQGLASLGKHHHTASLLSWDSTTLWQTKISLLQSRISLTFFFHFIMWSCSYFTHVPCYLFFALSGYCLIDSKQYWKHNRRMKCTQTITDHNTLMHIQGWCCSPYSIISSCPLHQARLQFAILFSRLERIYTPLWIYFLF